VYASVADLREEGVTAAMASDARLARLLEEATATIDRVTGWFFEPRPASYRLDGRGAPTLELPVPPIVLTRIDSAFEDDSFGQGTPTPLVPWGVPRLPIDERAMIVRGSPVTAGFDGPRITLRFGFAFPRGRGNVLVEGLWGYTEPDGTPHGRTPLAVRRAAMLLVLRNLAPLGNDDAVEARSRWRIVEERTRDQSYRLDPLRVRAPVLTGDPDVDVLLAPYVRPALLGAA